MAGIADRLQQKVVAVWAAGVLGRSVPFTREAYRVRAPRFGCKAFFNHDFVAPAIAEVIGVHGLGPRLTKHVEQARGSFAGRPRSAEDLLHRIGFAEPLFPDNKLMEMIVFPAHGQLQNIMQPLQRQNYNRGAFCFGNSGVRR